MLNRIVPLLAELEVATHWDVITGGNDFFEITKAFHNALHGGKYDLSRQAQEVFLATNAQNRQRLSFDEDVIVIHDPQPIALVCSKKDHPGRWVWRCHIDLSNPNPDVWGFLRPMVEQYDASIFSSPVFARQLSIPQYLLYPCLTPCQKRIKSWTKAISKKSATILVLTAPDRLLLRFLGSTALRTRWG